MVKFQSNFWTLAVVGFLMLAAAGCGKPQSTVVKPDMSPDELQAQIEANVAAANAGTEE